MFPLPFACLGLKSRVGITMLFNQRLTTLQVCGMDPGSLPFPWVFISSAARGTFWRELPKRQLGCASSMGISHFSLDAQQLIVCKCKGRSLMMANSQLSANGHLGEPVSESQGLARVFLTPPTPIAPFKE